LAVTYVGYRSAGTFPNPNYAAHFMMVLLWAVFGLTRRLRWLAVVAVGFVVTAFTTGSFGLLIGAAMPVPAYAYMTRRNLSFGAKLSRLLMAGGMAVLGIIVIFGGVTPDVAVSESLNPRRLDRTSTNRFDLWTDAIAAWEQDPLGLGPEEIVNQKILGHRSTSGTEAHSDYVTTLTERSLLGFLGLLLLIRGVWVASRGGVATSLVLIAVCAAGVFRDTIHYRHSLLVLGLLVCLDAQQRLQTGNR